MIEKFKNILGYAFLTTMYIGIGCAIIGSVLKEKGIAWNELHTKALAEIRTLSLFVKQFYLAHQDILDIYLSALAGVILTILVTLFLEYLKGKKSKECEQKEKTEKQKQLEEIYLEKKKYSAVPQEIEFSDNLLFIPSLEELGFPKVVAQFPHYIEIVENQIGQWVEIGDILMEIRFYFYHSELSKSTNKILSLLYYVHDFFELRKPYIDTFTIRSPIRGLLVYKRNVDCREGRTPTKRDIQDNYHCRPGILGTKKEALPCLLIPKSETNIDDDLLLNFRCSVKNSLKRKWQKNIHGVPILNGECCRIRISEAIEKNKFGESIALQRHIK
ncbi:hypothetical protein [Desulfobacter vibrioformis]|uniref:hypothetical protein n=1 Tax=Desulfobacter vibrioformis TaxID=34031 RepID=UPI0005593C1B|nr:hypothetical protein [Desulfobacter vibrioformis]